MYIFLKLHFWFLYEFYYSVNKQKIKENNENGHSDKKNNVYVSREYSKLQNTLPEFIKNNPDLNSKIQTIKRAPQDFGGDGALVIKLKKFTK